MVFQNPAAFLFILVVPLLFALRKAGFFRKFSIPLTLSDWGGTAFSWRGRLAAFLSFFSGALMLFGYIALVVAFSDPVVRHHEKVFTSRGTEILFVVDTSPSMAARDIPYLNSTINRLDAARLGIKTLVEAEKGATFALVAMASEAVSVVPPTCDHDVFLDRLDSLKIGALGDGSAIGTGLCSAVYHLVATSAPRKCIVLVTDGENNAGSIHPETAAALADENGISVYVLGIGTRGTVLVEYVDPNTGDVRSGLYESDFDRGALERIASAAGGRYFGIETIPSLSESLSSIAGRERVIQNFHIRTVEELFYYKFLVASAVLFMAGWFVRRVCLSEIL